MPKTVRTNDIFNSQIWKNILEQYGGNAEKIQQNEINQHVKKIMVSQNGEEGIIQYLFDKIGFTNKCCIEFGAIDGVRISNTYFLKEKHDFTRYLIEGNPNVKNNTNGEKIIKKLITPENINNILDEENCPDNVDFLSIDIDGDDYWVWKSMKHRARIVVIEYHSVLPNDKALAIIPSTGDVRSNEVSYPQKSSYNKITKRTERLNAYYGANLRAMFNLAKSKGYKFCTTLSDNAFFIVEEEFDKLNIPEISVDECIENYFIPSKWWVERMDKYNHEWIILDE
jgi:hypothetical protein